jgi:hypothetical protein
LRKVVNHLEADANLHANTRSDRLRRLRTESRLSGARLRRASERRVEERLNVSVVAASRGSCACRFPPHGLKWLRKRPNTRQREGYLTWRCRYLPRKR